MWFPRKPAPPVTSARGYLALAVVLATPEPRVTDVCGIHPVGAQGIATVPTPETPVADACGPDLLRVQGVAAIDEEGGLCIREATRSKLSSRNSSHSVRTTAACAPERAS
jgi:hypothetical protein